MNLFTLHAGTWVGMDRFGYGRDRSPIRIQEVTPLKMGAGHIRIDYFHLNYPEGVQDKSVELRVLDRNDQILIGVDTSGQVHIFSDLRPGWFEITGSGEPKGLERNPDPAVFLERIYSKR